MKVQTKIQKWSNGLIIRIAGIMWDIPHFKEGALIEVEVFENRLKIKKFQSKRKKHLSLPFSETELLKGMTIKTAYADQIIRKFMQR